MHHFFEAFFVRISVHQTLVHLAANGRSSPGAVAGSGFRPIAAIHVPQIFRMPATEPDVDQRRGIFGGRTSVAHGALAVRGLPTI
jgi:hypothetical protein